MEKWHGLDLKYISFVFVYDSKNPVTFKLMIIDSSNDKIIIKHFTREEIIKFLEWIKSFAIKNDFTWVDSHEL